ncbi:hypothetical protein T12_922 [Trichinella patagoniensis]|uniref:Uncharacterized protein n=1 Tax=Trichinella patagoniensis TaxID=990121 RepID=A0A0V0YS76_9BILA|nr:hypothetical protein T12_922 [Trichinella patagoniensis]
MLTNILRRYPNSKQMIRFTQRIILRENLRKQRPF